MRVTSAVIPIPAEWMKLSRLRAGVSIDGLPEHHDVRSKPAIYEHILKNIEGREVNIHWTITRSMLSHAGNMEEYVAFWNGRPEVNRIWVSLYTPQLGEQSPEMLGPQDREAIARELPALSKKYPELLMNEGISRTIPRPPNNPDDCLFSKTSANYSADLKSRVELCVFGRTPDCSRCGCAISSELHWVKSIKLAGPVKINHFVQSSINVSLLFNRLRQHSTQLTRWTHDASKLGAKPPADLVQIQP